ncbi:uncharacterized protein BDZ99DRAFT_511487 [Mytilinidion resinicola]|uniref:ABC transporter domain-containing protein n=1 Tax=Mytilinidion resinicola TaxID=574789 RepID=A0A6A6YA40_9PEZI|nr:uncharacterized protein BDZ99DRAFT_511487 [Mytilinidion resinicola]KAF2804985.1 hypothetical protein BDZ99DRAFT_511487 [Mytilinidion resinicola]
MRWKNVKVYGEDVGSRAQSDISTVISDLYKSVQGIWRRNPQKEILHGIDGVLNEGEMLLVLGGPGSGCTTLLKTLAGHHGGYSKKKGVIRCSGISITKVMERFRGSVVYNGAVESHFPELTVGQTLDFAAKTKTPHRRIDGISRAEYAARITDIIGTAFGLRHTFQTRVGNDFIRGVSGGERRRVTIAEMLMTRASVTCWDNPTRGLDSSTSLEFAQALRVATNLTGNVSISALYQPGEALAEIYDKVTLLYQGYQIWFGEIDDARKYFTEIGFEALPRQTTAEFLISITDPKSARVRMGYQHRVPRNAEEFVKIWKSSAAYKHMLTEFNEQEQRFPEDDEESYQRLKDHQVVEKTPFTRNHSAYTLNLGMQFLITLNRGYQRLVGNWIYYLVMTTTMVVIPIIIGSMFYNIPEDASGFISRGGMIFFSLLFNVIINFAETSAQFAQRPIVEKQNSYAMYHPFVDSLATGVVQYPLKLFNIAMFSAIVYFVAHLKREAGPLFIFMAFTYIISISMTGLFRTIAIFVNSMETALACTGLAMLPLAIYSGYVIPRPSMHPWFKWISYINPVYYANEAQMAVEFHGRRAPCTTLVPSGPGYEHVKLANQVCAVVGAKPGQAFVSGDEYVKLSFDFEYAHVWRNLGVCIAFFVLFTITSALAVEYKKSASTKSEFLVFRKTTKVSSKVSGNPRKRDIEQPHRGVELDVITEEKRESIAIERSDDIFCWRNLCYDIEIKGVPRRLLDNVQGFVEPGTLTALVGASGAGKTTLLNVLAQRVSMGVISGDMLVNGSPLDKSFQRRTGYVQQQDVHLAELTVRESFRFSALLRQGKEVPVSEKYAYVENIIAALGMQHYADAVIGTAEEGLSAEKRKRITIGLELVAKPTLLLFLDEPTSGLDSQSATSIMKFLRELANAGQAILCTIHQPSATLFEEFDRLLVLSRGGKTAYFGDLGQNSKIATDYFERHGAPPCEPTANSAEYILDVVGAGATQTAMADWAEVWKSSPECAAVTSRIRAIRAPRLQNKFQGIDSKFQFNKRIDPDGKMEADKTTDFATSWFTQFFAVQKRCFQHAWRSPVYLNSKFLINLFGGLFLGFTFYQENTSIQGLQNKTFAVFMILLLCLILIVLLQPRLLVIRDLYEVRERHSKMYHWTTFVIANIIVEIPFNFVISSVGFICWYFPVGWYRDSAVTPGRGLFIWFIFMLYQIYHTTFAQAIAMVCPNADTAAMMTILFYTFILAFNGVVQPLASLVKFWHFAYYVSPFTWLVSAMMSTGTHDVPVRCSAAEINIFQPPKGMSCGKYAGAFANGTMAALYNPKAMKNCEFCRFGIADAYLTAVHISYDDRWRNAAFMAAYIVFNICLFFITFYCHANGVKSVFGGMGKLFKKK